MLIHGSEFGLRIINRVCLKLLLVITRAVKTEYLFSLFVSEESDSLKSAESLNYFILDYRQPINRCQRLKRETKQS